MSSFANDNPDTGAPSFFGAGSAEIWRLAQRRRAEFLAALFCRILGKREAEKVDHFSAIPEHVGAEPRRTNRAAA